LSFCICLNLILFDLIQGVVNVGAVDADAHQSLGQRFGVSGFPSIKIFGSNKNKPEDYKGARSAQGFVDAGFKVLRDQVDDKLGGKRSGGSSGGSSVS
jgi:protein disulfide-isomerase A6